MIKNTILLSCTAKEMNRLSKVITLSVFCIILCVFRVGVELCVLAYMCVHVCVCVCECACVTHCVYA